MKVKPGHRRDFWAYVWFNRKFNKRTGSKGYFCPDANQFLRGTRSTLRCFVEYESLGYIGKKPPEDGIELPFDPIDHPRQPQLLKLALDGKKILNWHIEQWVEGLADGTLIPWEIREYIFVLPDWVGEAILNQWHRNVVNNYKQLEFLDGAYNLMQEYLGDKDV